jgi:hypothetical protein
MTQGEPLNPENSFHGEFHHSPVTARLPEVVSAGVYANGVIVLGGPHEVVVDFVLRLAPPHRVVGRVIMTSVVGAQFLQALKHNMELYEQHFGAIPPVPQFRDAPEPADPDVPEEKSSLAEPPLPTGESITAEAGAGTNDPVQETGATKISAPKIEDIYKELRLQDMDLAGHYANAVLLRHSSTEFCFDFICNIYPRSVVSMRVIMPTPQVPGLYQSLIGAIKTHRG